MTTNKNPRPLVPGTRKGSGAKNHLVKNRRNHKNFLKIKDRKNVLINSGTWNLRILSNEGNLDILLKKYEIV